MLWVRASALTSARIMQIPSARCQTGPFLAALSAPLCYADRTRTLAITAAVVLTCITIVVLLTLLSDNLASYMDANGD